MACEREPGSRLSGTGARAGYEGTFGDRVLGRRRPNRPGADSRLPDRNYCVTVTLPCMPMAWWGTQVKE